MDDLAKLSERFVSGDPSLLQEEIKYLKLNLSAENWRLTAQAAHDRIAKVTAISSGRTDAQIAEDYRKRMLEALGAVIDIINEARRDHGMTIGFQIGGPDGFNRQSLTLLEVSKKLC